jgi:hypothetical protein
MAESVPFSFVAISGPVVPEANRSSSRLSSDRVIIHFHCSAVTFLSLLETELRG